MSKRSIVFAMPAASADGVEIEISHVEARRLIRMYGLPNNKEDEAANHEVGSWEQRTNGRYFIWLHT